MVKGTPITMGLEALKRSGKVSRRDEYLVTSFRAWLRV